MKIRPLMAGAAAGAVLAAGGLAAVDLATESADAQGGGPVTQAQFRTLEARLTAVGRNSTAAQRISKNLQNVLGKHVTPEGTLIGAEQPPGVIRQDRGTGGGLPASLIADGAIGESKLTAPVRAKLDAGGPAGAPGATGPQGPTDAASGSTTPAPIPNPLPAGVSLGSAPVTTSIPGRLHAMINSVASIGCIPAGNAWLWVEVDGEALRSSVRQIFSGAHDWTASGVTEQALPAGPHTLHLRTACVAGITGVTALGSAQGSVVVIG